MLGAPNKRRRRNRCGGFFFPHGRCGCCTGANVGINRVEDAQSQRVVPFSGSSLILVRFSVRSASVVRLF